MALPMHGAADVGWGKETLAYCRIIPTGIKMFLSSSPSALQRYSYNAMLYSVLSYSASTLLNKISASDVHRSGNIRTVIAPNSKCFNNRGSFIIADSHQYEEMTITIMNNAVLVRSDVEPRTIRASVLPVVTFGPTASDGVC
jgi:hypothetical protein